MLPDAVQRHVRLAGCAAMLAALAPSAVTAQGDAKPLLQFEVGDSVGLPLPDARLEVFTLLERGIVWEWTRVEPAALGEGIWLVRFSHPGYRTAVMSVPLRKGSMAALRVRLDTLRDTVTTANKVIARTVRGSALALEGRAKTDIIGRRRVLAPTDIGVDTDGMTIGALMRRTENADVNVLPVSGGSFTVTSRYGGGRRCTFQVMVNGDRRRFLPFAAFDNLYGPSEIEALEIFPHTGSMPFAYQPASRGFCGIIVAWMKNP